jgi:hypothetical protein
MTFSFAFNKHEDRLQRNDYTMEEEEEIFNLSLQDVIDNPRWYLDNLDYLPQFTVRWKDYRKGYQITMPYCFCDEKKKNKSRVFK